MENSITPAENTGGKQNENLSQEQILLEVLENSRKTKNYMKWQLYITIALVVLPLLAALAIIPMVLSSLGNVYGSGGLYQ